jgi:hypothetical protein
MRVFDNFKEFLDFAKFVMGMLAMAVIQVFIL